MRGDSRIPMFLALMIALATGQAALGTQSETPPPYLTRFGKTGSGDGEFRYPHAIATDSLGRVYVTDKSNDRVQVFDAGGSYLTQWGSTGSGDGQFITPHGVAVDAAGNVYVADGSNYRIQKFDSNGNFLLKWGSSGSGDGQFNFPFAVAVDSAGNVYVPCSLNDRIQKFDSNGNFLGKWGTSGTGDGQFDGPSGVAVDAADNIFVCELLNHRVQKFDSNGTFLSKWGGPGSGDSEFTYPYGLETDGAGNVYVADSTNYRLQKFDNNGNFLSTFGYPLDCPKDVAINAAGTIYVTGHTYGVIEVYGTAPFTLSADHNQLSFGDQFKARNFAGCPNQAAFLFLVDFSGTPMFLRLDNQSLDGDGAWEVYGRYSDPALAGNTATLMTLSYGCNGGVIATNPETLVFN